MAASELSELVLPRSTAADFIYILCEAFRRLTQLPYPICLPLTDAVFAFRAKEIVSHTVLAGARRIVPYRTDFGHWKEDHLNSTRFQEFVMGQLSTRCTSLFLYRSRAESLKAGFLACLDQIELHKEASLPRGFISDYKALGWLEVKDGAHQITSNGTQVVRELQKLAHQGKA